MSSRVNLRMYLGEMPVELKEAIEGREAVLMMAPEHLLLALALAPLPLRPTVVNVLVLTRFVEWHLGGSIEVARFAGLLAPRLIWVGLGIMLVESLPLDELQTAGLAF